jgi:hypothetical protein
MRRWWWLRRWRRLRLNALDVIDVLGGFATLGKRSQTLDGSVPVRVAQGCVPLLEGNAWGWQVTLARPIELRKKLTGWAASGAGLDELQRMTRAAVPMLRRDGTLRDGRWLKRLERGAVDVGRTVSVFTGLFVRPRPGWRLRVSSLANRRSWLYSVEELLVDDSDAFTPLMLDVVPTRDVESLRLEGEVATIGVLPARVTHTAASLGEDDAVARAHVGFYDGEYFDTKKRGNVARKYRDDIVRSPRPASEEPAAMRIVHGGPVHVEALTDRARVRNAISFVATFDGYKVHIEPHPGELETLARGTRDAWDAWRSASGVAFHDGALLYLTKYFTPHPAGEPHFFVKPPTLVATTPGTSTLIDGIPGGGYDVMRGVVRTDSFHAVPAVFQLWQPGTTISVARGTPLCDLFVFPRALDDATFELVTSGPAGAWS